MQASYVKEAGGAIFERTECRSSRLLVYDKCAHWRSGLSVFVSNAWRSNLVHASCCTIRFFFHFTTGDDATREQRAAPRLQVPRGAFL